MTGIFRRGDMTRRVYDTNKNDIVDEAENCTGAGDMDSDTYDPRTIEADVFDVDNHTDGSTNKVYTATEQSKLAGIESGATADQTKADIDALGLSHDSLADVSTSDHHVKYTDAEAVIAAKTVKLDDFTAPDDTTDLDATDSLHGLMPKADKGKLDGIEAGADVTDAENVASAGAVMDTDFTQDGGILVGTGSGTFAEETGATLRTSIDTYSTSDTDSAIDADVATHAAVTTSVHNFDASGNAPPQNHASNHTDGTDDVADMVGDSGAGGTHGLVPAPGAGDAAANKYLKADGVWTTIAGGGDVTSSANIDDHTIVRGDGGAKGVQDSGISIDDSDNLTMPVSTNLTIGDGGETITSDNTDMTLTSGVDINLTATGDVNIPANVGLEFAGAEKIESDGTDISITVGAGGDINVGADIGITFGDDGEKIEGNGTALTINSSEDLNLTASADINVPANVGMTFGDDGEKIEGDGTDLTIASSGVLNLNATTQLIENKIVLFDFVLSADETYSGYGFQATAGTATTFGEAYYLSSTDSKWEKAQGDDEATYKPMTAVCCVASAEDATSTFLSFGTIRDDDWSWTVGGPIYIDDDTAGALTQTTNASTKYQKCIGWAITSASIFVVPNPDWVKVK